MSTNNNLNDIFIENINRLKRYRNEFMEIFGVDPKNYWENNFLGFDVIGFDEKFIKTPDNMSMREYVTEKYGKKGYDVFTKISGIDFDEEY
jgi:hypothetical protein